MVPIVSTVIPKENGESDTLSDPAPKEIQKTELGLDTQNETNVKFPEKLRYKKRGKVFATIYKKKDSPGYTLYYRAQVDGKRKSRFQEFKTYAEAKRMGDRVVAERAADGDRVLSKDQRHDAFLAIDELQKLFADTGERLSLFKAAGQIAAAKRRLGSRSLNDAIDGYLSTVVTVKRTPLSSAVEAFIKADDAKTDALEGQRPQLSKGFAKQKAQMLREFNEMLPNYAVCDLSKELLNTFFANIRSRKRYPTRSPKSRNHRRAVLRQFIKWAVRNDWLPANHRLFEADSMRVEPTDGGETAIYSPTEFRTLLESAEGPMRALIAIGGFAGLRTAELLRLDWSDVWRRPGYVEVTAKKSKTRARRLVEICPALAAWLRPFSKFKTGPLWEMPSWKAGENKFHQAFGKLCEESKVNRARNALRHSFCSYRYALSNENEVASLAGNKPNIIFKHYRQLATKKEAKAWFANRPAKSANVIELNVKEA